MNNKLLIEAKNTDQLIDLFWAGTASGMTKLMEDILHDINSGKVMDSGGVKALKKKYKDRQFYPNAEDPKQVKMNTFDCCTKPVPLEMKAAIVGNAYHETYAVHDLIFGVKQKETETTMYADNRTEAQQAKDYLIESARVVAREKDKEVRKDFYIDYTGPETIGEMKEAIKNGWVSMPEQTEKMADNTPIWAVGQIVEFRDPAKKEDREGYKKAQKEITQDHSDVKDAIIVLGAEKGLEKLNEWKAKTYH